MILDLWLTIISCIVNKIYHDVSGKGGKAGKGERRKGGKGERRERGVRRKGGKGGKGERGNGE